MNENSHHYIPQHLRIAAGLRMTLRWKNKESVADISRETGISRSHLYILEKKYLDDPTMEVEERPGRPRIYDEHTERRIVRQINKDPFESASCIVKDINTGMEEEKKISTRTFYRIAHKKGLRSYRPYYRFDLTPDHIEARLTYALNYQNKDMRFWKNVLFADEIKLRLGDKDKRKRARRLRGHRKDLRLTVRLRKTYGAGIMFWGCFSWRGVGTLIPVEGSINGDRYAELLENVIPQTKRNLNMPSPYLLQDKASVHMTQRVFEARTNLNIKSLENYPANSPDLNPIEELWSFWKSKVMAREPKTLQQLQTYALQEWTNLPLEKLRRFIKRLPNTLKEVVSMNGEYTHY